MNFLHSVAMLRAELASVEAALAFADKVLPAGWLERVLHCSLKGQTARLHLDANAPNALQELTAAFPLAENQYLATHTGTPVARSQTVLGSVVEAAVPVHAAWRRDSDVLGTAVCWTSNCDGILVDIEASGALAEARALWWEGLTPLCNVRGRTLFAYPLPSVAVQPLSPEVSPPALLKDIVRFLNDIVTAESPIRRGYAPPELLTWFAQKAFGVQVEVTKRHVTWSCSAAPARYYAVQLKDPKGHWWHELDGIRQAYRQGEPTDLLWYDLLTSPPPAALAC